MPKTTTEKCDRPPILQLLALILTVVAAAVLRFWGLRWGLPNSLHDFSYHPDEVFQIGAMLKMFTGGLDPGFYNYPSGYLNMGAGAIKIAAGYGLSMDRLIGPYLVARSVTVVTGVLTVPIVYGIGNRLYGRTAGLIAAVIMAIAPLHIVHSHFATVDVPATLWVAAGLLLAACIYTRPTIAIYIGAGAAAGFAMGTKYNAALVLVPVMVAHFVREDDASFQSRLKDGRLWFAVASFVLGFLAASPGWLLWSSKFSGGFLYELRHAATGHGLVFVGRGPGWFDVISNSLGYGLGVFMLVLSLCAFAYACVRHKRQDLILLSFLVPYFLMVSFSEVRFARYAIPMIPVIAVLVARMLDCVYRLLQEQDVRFLRFIWVAVGAFVICYTAVYAAAFDRLFSQPDPRETALSWFAGAHESAKIGLPTPPWFYSPPFAPGITGIPGADRRLHAMAESRFHLIANPERDWDTAIITDAKPDFIVISDYESGDPERLRERHFEEFSRDLKKGYIEAEVFRSRFSVCGIDFGPTERLPHDLKYMAPTIRVYRRK